MRDDYTPKQWSLNLAAELVALVMAHGADAVPVIECKLRLVEMQGQHKGLDAAKAALQRTNLPAETIA
jgi:hypothetical protein